MTARGRRAGDALRRFPMKVGGGFGPRPPILAGLEFWGDLLSPDTSIVSGAVATLGDSSGYGRNFTQGTSTRRPTYSASDANFGGRPTRTYDGVDDNLNRTTDFGGGSAFTVYLVMRTTTIAASDQRVFGCRIGAIDNAFRVAIFMDSLSMSVAHPVGSETQKRVTIAANTSYRFAATINLAASGTSAVPKVYLDGVDTGTYASSASTAGGPASNSPYAEGATDVASAPFSGTVADSLVFQGNHSASQVALMDSWLKWRNGL